MSISTAKIAKSSLWLTASFLIAKSSQLIAQVFLARLLAPEAFGTWGMVLVLTKLSELFKDWAIAAVLIQRGFGDKKLVDAVYSLGVNVAVVMCLLQILLGFPLAHFFQEPLVAPLTALASLVFLIGAGTGSHTAFLQRQMKFREIGIINGITGLVRLFSSVICASSGGGIWSFAVAEIAASIVDRSLKRHFSGYSFTYHLFPDAQAVKEVRGFIGSLIGINLAVYANTNSDNFLIGKLLGARTLGFYSLAYQLAMIPAFAVTQLNRVSFSVLSQQSDAEKQVHVQSTFETYALLYAPIYGAAFVVAPWFIPLLYGPSWIEAVGLFQIVLVFAYARGFMSILGTALNALNKPEMNAAINWVLVPISVPAYFIGAKVGGSAGVAIAVALVMGIGATAWFWLATCRVAGWSVVVLAKPVILPTAAITATVLAVMALPLPIELQPYLQLPLVVLGYGVVVSVCSGGRIPMKMLAVIKEVLKPNVRRIKKT
jgi:lipopolysaccharide exporter